MAIESISQIGQLSQPLQKIGMGSFAKDLMGTVEKSNGFDASLIQASNHMTDVGRSSQAAPIQFQGNPNAVMPGMEMPEKAPNVVDLVGNLIDSVDAKSKASSDEIRKVFSGESQNLHQAMIAMEESGVAFTLMLEVRNKLVEGFQELMKMSI